MRSAQVTRRQARTLKSNLEPVRDYLDRLAKRMKHQSFPSDDPLMTLVRKAQLAIHELTNDLLIRTLERPVTPPAPPPTIGMSKRALEIQDRRQGKR
jgi:hypothetical protein